MASRSQGNSQQQINAAFDQAPGLSPTANVAGRLQMLGATPATSRYANDRAFQRKYRAYKLRQLAQRDPEAAEYYARAFPRAYETASANRSRGGPSMMDRILTLGS